VEGISLRGSLSSARQRLDFKGETRIGTDHIDAAAWPSVTTKLSKLLPKFGGVAMVSAISFDGQAALGARLKELDEGFRSKRVSATTKAQTEAWIKSAVLTAQIDGGRLPLVGRGPQRTRHGP